MRQVLVKNCQLKIFCFKYEKNFFKTYWYTVRLAQIMLLLLFIHCCYSVESFILVKAVIVKSVIEIVPVFLECWNGGDRSCPAAEPGGQLPTQLLDLKISYKLRSYLPRSKRSTIYASSACPMQEVKSSCI